MAAILGLDLEAVLRAVNDAEEGEICGVAIDNAPGQVVISGHVGAVNRAIELLKAAGAKRALPLPVSAPFHCALMRLAADAAHPAPVPEQPRSPLQQQRPPGGPMPAPAGQIRDLSRRWRRHRRRHRRSPRLHSRSAQRPARRPCRRHRLAAYPQPRRIGRREHALPRRVFAQRCPATKPRRPAQACRQADHRHRRHRRRLPWRGAGHLDHVASAASSTARAAGEIVRACPRPRAARWRRQAEHGKSSRGLLQVSTAWLSSCFVGQQISASLLLDRKARTAGDASGRLTGSVETRRISKPVRQFTRIGGDMGQQ